MQSPVPTILTVVSEPFDENTYIAFHGGSDRCLVVDPGFDPQRIFATLDEQGLVPVAILCTHGHADHIAGNASLKQRWPDCVLYIGEGDADKLVDPAANLSAGFGINLVSPRADQTLREGDRLALAGFEFTVRETPGHSSGHVVFIAEGVQPPFVFGGDVLFAGSIGRTDFPDGSFEGLKSSIHEKLFNLPDDTIVYSGHGPTTTVGREKATNPFVALRG